MQVGLQVRLQKCVLSQILKNKKYSTTNHTVIAQTLLLTPLLIQLNNLFTFMIKQRVESKGQERHIVTEGIPLGHKVFWFVLS